MKPPEGPVDPLKELGLHDQYQAWFAWWNYEMSYDTVLIGVSFKGLANTLNPVFGSSVLVELWLRECPVNAQKELGLYDIRRPS